MNGMERFIVEKIRVNTEYNFGSIHPTQAELISSVLVIAGLAIIVYQKKNGKIENVKPVI